MLADRACDVLSRSILTLTSGMKVMLTCTTLLLSVLLDTSVFKGKNLHHAVEAIEN